MGLEQMEHATSARQDKAARSLAGAVNGSNMGEVRAEKKSLDDDVDARVRSKLLGVFGGRGSEADGAYVWEW